MSQVHVELKNVSKAVFRKVNHGRIKTQILSGLDLIIEKGELVTIMGPSGSGKTTLIRLINRLSETDSGTITLNGKDIRDYAPADLRRKVGMVFQLPVVFNGSVHDNLAFGTKLWGNNIDLDSLAKACGISEALLNADAAQLSVGEKQRVCIARALANHPEVLLLDEPTSSLDAVNAERIEKLLLDLRKESNLTMVWITHEREQARRIGGRGLLLKDGKLVEQKHG